MSKKPFKIAFVGTSCTGKTTLIEEYRKRFTGNPTVAIVDEAARIFFSKNPKIAQRFGLKPQREIQKLVLKLESQVHHSDVKLIFCDRSVIDAAVYVKATGDKKGSHELFAIVQHWLPTYDKFYLLDPEGIPYNVDTIRQENISDRQKLHDAFIDFFAEASIPYEILSGSLEQRMAIVDKILPKI